VGPLVEGSGREAGIVAGLLRLASSRGRRLSEQNRLLQRVGCRFPSARIDLERRGDKLRALSKDLLGIMLYRKGLQRAVCHALGRNPPRRGRGTAGP
jgi:hypothetical protein